MMTRWCSMPVIVLQRKYDLNRQSVVIFFMTNSIMNLTGANINTQDEIPQNIGPQCEYIMWLSI
jgi:hypothetical protein